MRMRPTLTFAALLFLINAATVMAASGLKQIGEFVVPEANQGVGVDDRYFYAVDNQTIAKYEKKTGKLIRKWQGEKNGSIIHLDSAMLLDGKIYCAHSNYSEWPMTSSVEIWNADTMEHVGNHSFGINWGSLTWVDFYNGHWWMTFANYDKPFGPGKTPYGHKVTTQTVKFSADFQYRESWVLPKAILDRFEDMSNSGGSWGPDGYLYLSGHDPAEIYRMRLPKAGSILELVDAIPMNIRGQGIAWDRSERGVIYGIIRATAKEKAAGGNHKVTISKLIDTP
jgi:hypothetical protein